MRPKSYIIRSSLLAIVLVAGSSVAQANTTQSEQASKSPSTRHIAVSGKAERSSSRFQTGYHAACDYATFGRPRDDFAYREQPAYRAGWKAGYAACLDHSYMGNAGKKVTYN
ncbi:MAG: hypothetical protein KGO02_19730 [Alphaproteobacteria bacterium]|nr:hypothetical protein [Alphaproteobacteria bacterium]